MLIVAVGMIVQVLPTALLSTVGVMLAGSLATASALALVYGGFTARRRLIAVLLHTAGLLLLYEVSIMLRATRG
jgi:hypothetical protein